MYRFARSLALPLAIACTALAGCPSGGGTAPEAPSGPAPASSATKPASAKLVLGIVLDQLPSSAVLRFAPHLPEDGVLRRAMEQGLFQERVRYGYAGTNTAPGHASIYTGELPADHGIDRNDVFSSSGGRKQIVDDGEHAVFGVEGSFASPFRLLKPTIGDHLHKNNPNSKVVSVSLKARAAVVSAGQTPDLVTWYDPSLPGFTTSSAYAEEMPAWMANWNQANPVSDRLTPWTAENPKLYEELLGPDDAPGEADWYGLGTTFPHNLAETEKPPKTFVASPQSMDYLLDMTRAVAKEHKLGQDEAPDLLMLSVSTTDYAGHSYGQASWEYLDVLIKTDRALGKLVRELEAETELAVLITSDHGGTPLAEASIAAGKPGGRLYGDVFVAALEERATKEFGEGPWFEAYIQPYLYLTDKALGSEKLAALEALAVDYAKSAKDVEAVVPSALARTLRNSDNWLERDVANTVAERSKALFVVPAEWHVGSSTKGYLGTGHGTPWDTDREVCVLAFGAGVTKHRDAEVVHQNRVAPTIAALLGLSWHLPAEAFTGAPAAEPVK